MSAVAARTLLLLGLVVGGARLARAASIPARATTRGHEQRVRLAEQLVREHERDPEAWLALARLHLDPAWLYRRPARAESAARRALALSGRTPEILSILAAAHFEQSEHADALAVIAELVDAAPPRVRGRELADLLSIRAEILLRDPTRCPDARSRAMGELARAIDVDPGNWRPRLLRAEALLADGDHEAALADFEVAARASPGSRQAHFGLFTAAAKLGRSELAQRHYEIWKRLNRLIESVSARNAPDDIEACHLLRELKELNPSDVPHRIDLAERLLELGDWRGALGECDELAAMGVTAVRLQVARAAALRGQRAAGAPDRTSARFVERADCGIDFVHRRYTTQGRKYLVEMMGGSLGLFDYDRDGDLDLYCVQECPLPGHPGGERAQSDRLYRNEGGLRFTPVPPFDECGASLGLDDREYGMSVSCPDVDGDGWPDLFVTGLRGEKLYRNQGDGTFADVTAQSGIDDLSWSTAAAWADLDSDGDLDLYLGNYAILDFERYRVCGTPEHVRYCNPDALGPGVPDRLYRNDGGFRFVEVTHDAGIVEEPPRGKALAVVPLDVNDDGRLDLFVANDGDPNFLWVNQGGMRFEDRAAWAGVGVSGRGASQACMGTDVADVDGDLDFDLFAANFGREPNVLYVRDQGEFFTDRSYPSGLGEPSFLFTGFGARFFDHDRDGDQDLMVVNGHIDDEIASHDPAQSFAQVPHLYDNRGRGTFDSIGPRVSPFFTRPAVGRALATGDLDDDGDVDVLTIANDGPVVLLENQPPAQNRWIGFALTGTKSPRTPIGATVTIECAGKPQIQLVTGSASYFAWNDLRLLFGVGPVDAATTVNATIRWPAGGIQELNELALDRYHELEEPDER